MLFGEGKRPEAAVEVWFASRLLKWTVSQKERSSFGKAGAPLIASCW